MATPKSLFCGGILAEEMGLGKTAEIIALVLANPAPPSWIHQSSTSSNGGRAVGLKGTLVVCPQTLVRQWQAELQRHAPGLNVGVYQKGERLYPEWDDLCQEFEQLCNMLNEDHQFHDTATNYYGGECCKFAPERAAERVPRFAELRTLIKDMYEKAGGCFFTASLLEKNKKDFDVIIIPFENISGGGYYGMRAAASVPEYCNLTLTSVQTQQLSEPPLNKILHGSSFAYGSQNPKWWRVVLDEAQMVSNAANLRSQSMSRISSRSRWCVSGTPLNNNLEDLNGLLHFLSRGVFGEKNILER